MGKREGSLRPVKPFTSTEERAVQRLLTFTLTSTTPHQLGPLPYYSVSIFGTPIGRVYRSTETVERKPRGSRIVTRRWSRLCWARDTADSAGYFPLRWFAFDTRAKVAANLLMNAMASDAKLAAKVRRALRRVSTPRGGVRGVL